MKVFSIAKGFYRLSKNAPPELSQKEFDRLRAITIYRETRDVKLVYQTFGISRATLYRWLERFDSKDLTSLKEQSRRPRRVRRPYGVRKPKDYNVERPGDLVEVDTLDVRPFPWMILKQFTARDVISKWDVIEARRRATATTAKEFVETLEQRMPFQVRALQVDGGSEFYSDFEEECQRRKIQLFVLPPKSPKLNGCVERAHRTHTEEFYEVYECSWNLRELNPELRHWEYIYNCVRPHQSLNYKTPLQFLRDSGIVDSSYPSNLSHM